MALTELPPALSTVPQALPFAAPHDHDLDPVLRDFHPAVRTWFARAFPLGPTDPQAQAWPNIAAGHDTLVAAPTGSGKTLSAFLVAIDDLYKRHEADEYGVLLVSDIGRKVLATGRRPERINVYEVMAKPAITVPASMGIADCARLLLAGAPSIK